ncbi:BON domain-containing protein [Azorhizobium doebereinerae]|uniref:BON domain-containing protein n=1 Tax=Azorhizobium doebereinerae TaxID=281091 RepID=UPI00040D9857|nr:BON domain-containing protein [Azorhizobium doebereinerae]
MHARSGPGRRAGTMDGTRAGGAWRWDVRVLGLGALLFCALAVFAVVDSRPDVEADLTQRAAEQLEATGESWAVARFSGRDATLFGEALAQEARDKVRAAVEGVSGVRAVEDATTLLPERRPFTFSVVRSGATLQIEGYVPSQYALMGIAEAVKALPPGLTVRGLDRLVRARGAPAGDFAAVVAFALKLLAQLPAGRVTLSDDSFAIEGRAPDLATYDALQRVLHEPLPQDFRLARFALRPPVVSPYVWSAARDGDTVHLKGYVPSEAARQEVVKALHDTMPDAGVADGTVLGDGAPATDLWLRAVRFAAAQLAILPRGQVGLSDMAITLEGAAGSFAVYDALVAARRAPPEGFQIARFAIEPPPAVPFVWRIWRQGPQVRLSGYAPGEEARRVMGDAVKALFPGGQVSDQVRLASGGPPSDAWTAAATYALAQVSRMGAGEATLLDNTLTLSGEATDSASYANLAEALKAPPPGVRLEAARVLPPVISPYVFAARSDETGVTLSGFFPDADTHARVKAAVARLFPAARLTDVAAVGAGAPAHFAEAVEAALGPLARLEAGDLRFGDGQVMLAGTGRYPAAGALAAAELKAALPPGFAAEVSVDAPAPGLPVGAAECVRLLGDAAARGLSFDAAGRPAGDSLPTLDRMAAAALRCPVLLLQPAPGTTIPSAAVAARGAALKAHLVAAGVPDHHVIWAPDAPEPVPGDPALTVAGVRIIVRAAP